MLVTCFVFVVQTNNVKSIETTLDEEKVDIEQVIQDFVYNSEKDVNADDIISFLNGNAQKQSVSSDDILYFGEEYVVNPDWTPYLSASALSSHKFVVAYRDHYNSGYGTARVGAISGDVIGFGAEYVFNPGSTFDISVAALSSEKFVVAYRDVDNNIYGTACVGSISGNVIDFSGEQLFNLGKTFDISVAALPSEKFVLAYSDSDTFTGRARICAVISGDTIDFGPDYVFNSITNYISVAALSSEKFVVTYQDFSNSYYGTACVGAILGNVIDFGDEYVFNQVEVRDVSVAALSSHKFVVAYQDYGDLKYGTARVGAISGDVIGFGAKYVFNQDETRDVTVAALSSEKFVVAYQDLINSQIGTACVGTVSDSDISFSLEYVFTSDGTQGPSIATFTLKKFVVVYAVSESGMGVIGTLNSPPNVPTITGPQNGEVGQSYTFTFTATDPNEHQVEYYIEWGDGTSGGWYGPYDSGDPQNVGHVWNAEDTYTIRCKARDEYYQESDWGEFTVTIPRNKAINFNFLEWLFVRFPSTFPILRNILKI
jgi:hypothetical protein